MDKIIPKVGMTEPGSWVGWWTNLRAVYSPEAINRMKGSSRVWQEAAMPAGTQATMA